MSSMQDSKRGSVTTTGAQTQTEHRISVYLLSEMCGRIC